MKQNTDVSTLKSEFHSPQKIWDYFKQLQSRSYRSKLISLFCIHYQRNYTTIHVKKRMKRKRF